MFQYSIEVLNGRKQEIESHLADIYSKAGGLVGVLEAQRKIHDLSDAIEVLEGLNEDLKKDDLLENVEGNPEKEGKLSFDSEEEAYC